MKRSRMGVALSPAKLAQKFSAWSRLGARMVVAPSGMMLPHFQTWCGASDGGRKTYCPLPSVCTPGPNVLRRVWTRRFSDNRTCPHHTRQAVIQSAEQDRGARRSRCPYRRLLLRASDRGVEPLVHRISAVINDEDAGELRTLNLVRRRGIAGCE